MGGSADHRFAGMQWVRRLFLGPDLVQQTTEWVADIRDHMLAAQSRQKSYADVRRQDLEF